MWTSFEQERGHWLWTPNSAKTSEKRGGATRSERGAPKVGGKERSKADLAETTKEEAAARDKGLHELFKVAINQSKVPVGVDPKSVVCAFFQHVQCTKGFQCKPSNDLSVERKGEQVDIYSDQRDKENLNAWDLATLEKAVAERANEYNNNTPTEMLLNVVICVLNLGGNKMVQEKIPTYLKP